MEVKYEPAYTIKGEKRMADQNPSEIAPEERAVEGYIGKVETLALLLLGGVEPESLKTWYDVSEKDLAKAREKIIKIGGGR